MKKILSVVLIFFISIVFLTPNVFAQENQFTGHVASEIYNEKIKDFQKYIDVSGNLIDFDYEQAILDGADPQLATELKETYEKANIYLTENETGLLQQNVFSRSSVEKNCSGQNKYDGNMVAGTMYIDSCKTNKIIAIIAIGGGAHAIMAFLPFPGAAPVFGIASAVYVIGGGILAYNNADGTGVKIRILVNPITNDFYPYWVNPQ
ncbi:hypothetical protein [Lysinibacillus piscis]|uniref:Uncharacterized protein n=1 Tax=Lysinibacillus piscis TaxID=2518931 RepID=A0ABQ5NKC2_9BACI|nr:hypothetical protein [Lysinibacillus sp. KH24]GLC88809.1 hypothetical protein LYSBPC_19360 [Lysinibacillus sp. KH24]